jgi:beta-glucosidase-like glycosyl hydrolase/CubicO group peptidase (beta-lactamase class C family)
MRASIIGILLIFLSVPVGIGSHASIEEVDKTIDRRAENKWVETIFNQMTEDERIGQLINVRAHSNKGESHVRSVSNMIKKYKAGGVTFFQGTPAKQIQYANRFQKLTTKVPLMVAIDGEWGLGMRMKSSTISYPRQLTLGAIQDNGLIYKMGQEIARQCKRVGVHVNFAPVVDVNNNPNNPVINDRSFGENRYNVTAKSYMYMKGMQDAQVLACAKHFPGHGDTDVDSHHDLPVIFHNKSRLDSVELFPFKVLAQHDIGSMMIAHLSIPSLDNTKNLPSSLSRKIVTDLLIKDLGYEGLIFTDGMEMQGVRKYFKRGQAEVKALEAGNDIVLLPPDLPASFKAIKAAIKNGKINKTEFEHKVKKVLRQKYRLGLNKHSHISAKNVYSDLNNSAARKLKRELYEAAITAVRNKNNVLPLPRIDNQKIATISIGKGRKTRFQRQLDKYSKGIKHYYTGKEVSSSRSRSLIRSLKKRSVVIVSLHGMSKTARKNFGISKSARKFLDKLRKETNVVVVVFGSPYSVKYFDNIGSVVVAYEENSITEELVAKGIFGGAVMKGRLPVTASSQAKYGDGVNVGDNQKLLVTSPSVVGMDAKVLAKIDRIAKEAINGGATPGLQVLIAKDSRIVYNKAFGHHTYRKQVPYQTDNVYDMASVTKICAATVSVMKLVDEGKVNINRSLGTYIPKLKGTNKEHLIIKDVMAHQARLQAWIPFYKETIIGSKYPSYKEGIYQKTPSEQYSFQVADDLYINKNYKKTIYQAIIDSPLRKRRGYKYSDLGFYLIRDLVENVTKMPFEDYVVKTFYEPMGLASAGFNPAKRLDVSKIPPTENDDYWRNQVVKGYVHDMGAAMLNGVSGHAGLFAKAEEIAAILQMLLNNGVYNGKEYLKASTIKQFTVRHPRSKRRGIGFDMKDLKARKKMTHISKMASSRAFGHLGFTGISVWADPKYNLIYVFCSNRTFPKMNNRKIIKMDIRPRMQSVAYQAIK